MGREHGCSLAGGTPCDSSDPAPGRTGSASLSARRGTGNLSVLTGALLSHAALRGNAGTRRLRDAGADEPDADTRGSEPDSTCPSGLFSDRRQNLTCSATSHTGNESATRYAIAVSDAMARSPPRLATGHCIINCPRATVVAGGKPAGHAKESGAYAGFPCERAGSCPTQGGFPGAVSQDWQRSGKAIGAEGGSRTHTPFRVHDFESCASASSATSALIRHTAVCYRRPSRLDQQPPSVNRSGNGPTGTGASFSVASDALRLASLAPAGLRWLAVCPSTRHQSDALPLSISQS